MGKIKTLTHIHCAHNYLPLFIFPHYIKKSSATFNTPTGEVVIRAPSALLVDCLHLCDGTRTLSEITNMLSGKWEHNLLSDFFADLDEAGIICDSRCISKHIWKYSYNPSSFPVKTSAATTFDMLKNAHDRHYSKPDPFQELTVENFDIRRFLDRRKSVRSFSDRSIATTDIAKILWACYGTTSHPLSITGDLFVARHTVHRRVPCIP